MSSSLRQKEWSFTRMLNIYTVTVPLGLAKDSTWNPSPSQWILSLSPLVPPGLTTLAEEQIAGEPSLALDSLKNGRLPSHLSNGLRETLPSGLLLESQECTQHCASFSVDDTTLSLLMLNLRREPCHVPGQWDLYKLHRYGGPLTILGYSSYPWPVFLLGHPGLATCCLPGPLGLTS